MKEYSVTLGSDIGSINEMLISIKLMSLKFVPKRQSYEGLML